MFGGAAPPRGVRNVRTSARTDSGSRHAGRYTLPARRAVPDRPLSALSRADAARTYPPPAIGARSCPASEANPRRSRRAVRCACCGPWARARRGHPDRLVARVHLHVCQRSKHECMQVAVTARAGTVALSDPSFGGAEESSTARLATRARLALFMASGSYASVVPWL